MNDNANNFSNFSEMLKKALGNKVDQTAEGFIDLMAPDGVMEFPFAPENGVKQVMGREALVDYLAGLQDRLSIDSISDPKVHLTQNADVIILEFTCAGHALKTGRSYNQRYISVITLCDGKIAHYADYWNPLMAIDALGDLESLKQA